MIAGHNNRKNNTKTANNYIGHQKVGVKIFQVSNKYPQMTYTAHDPDSNKRQTQKF